MGEIVDLSGSFMATLDEDDSFVSPIDSVKISTCDVPEMFPEDINQSLNMTREMLIKAQQGDPSLVPCFSSVVDREGSKAPVKYFICSNLL